MSDRSDHIWTSTAVPPPPGPPPMSGPPPMQPRGFGPPPRPAVSMAVRPQTPSGQEVASLGERVGARAIDAACGLVLLLPLLGLQAALYAIFGIERDVEGDDPLSSVFGFLFSIVIVSYDALTFRVFGGATPGKKLTKRQIVRWGDDAPVGPLLLLGRNAILLLEWVFLVPGILDFKSTAERDDGRTWADRATGTAVVNLRASTRPLPAPPHAPVWRPEPWGSLVHAAGEARTRLARNLQSVPKGPLRERLDEVATRVAACELECARVADRGVQLSQAAEGTDVEALTSRLESVAAEPGKETLAEAYERELASARRLVALVESTTQRLQQLVAELNSAVNTGIEIALTPTDNRTFDLLLDQLDALRQSLAIVERESAPPAPI